MLTGLQGVLVSLQLLTHLALYNVVSRTDSPPWWLVWPLQGPIGQVIFCFDLPLIGKVRVKKKQEL